MMDSTFLTNAVEGLTKRQEAMAKARAAKVAKKAQREAAKIAGITGEKPEQIFVLHAGNVDAPVVTSGISYDEMKEKAVAKLKMTWVEVMRHNYLFQVVTPARAKEMGLE